MAILMHYLRDTYIVIGSNYNLTGNGIKDSCTWLSILNDRKFASAQHNLSRYSITYQTFENINLTMSNVIQV